MSADCQLELDQEIDAINCKSEVTDSCLAAVKNWALAYKNCDNADDPECKEQDPNYAASQKTWQSCSTLSVSGKICNVNIRDNVVISRITHWPLNQFFYNFTWI